MSVAESYDPWKRPTQREADRYSTILGNPCRIMMPLGTPKPKEECQPFTFELYPISDVAAPTPWGIRDMEKRLAAAEKLRDKLKPKLEKAAEGKMRRSKVTPLSGFLAIRFKRG